ncbi:MAG TPA: universal stress protein, partial [Candidatus Dormibacteraeota bacterium]|nr:universal stress protein [Candidatus Dormibacteraeota bacterium]
MEAHVKSNGDGAASWIKRVVVAADGSPASIQGLEQVADLAARLKPKVFVVHVRHMPAGLEVGSVLVTQSVVDTLDELEVEVREQALRILGGTGVEWDFVVRVGSPGEEIVKVATEVSADLVVVGSNRHSSLHNLVLGSTAAFLTARSPVPVLVMRSLVPTAREP